MAIPEPLRRAALETAESYCDDRVPEHVRDQVRLEATVRGGTVTIVERRRPWREDLGPEWSSTSIARMRYDPATALWTLFWADRNGRWLRYPCAEPARSIEDLLEAIENDHSGAFFG